LIEICGLFAGLILDQRNMTTPHPYTRVCVLLPRMTDDQAAYYDPAGLGAVWANRLFGAVGMDHIREIQEGITVVAATCELDLIAALMWIDQPSRLYPSMGAHIIEGRLTDDDLAIVEPERFQFLEVLDLALENVSVAEIERVIESLPFKAYRIERDRTAPRRWPRLMFRPLTGSRNCPASRVMTSGRPDGGADHYRSGPSSSASSTSNSPMPHTL
jgi:hypothetical protein